MKHIILEAPDRCGKNTAISYISSKHSNYTVRHFGKPEGYSNEEKTFFQKRDFLNEFCFAHSFFKNYKRNDKDLLIWNRSHIGEWAYGKIHRKSESSWIWSLEKDFLWENDDNKYLIFLYGDPEFLISNEDGNSLSAKLDDRKLELDYFNEAYELTSIKNKIKFKVNKNNNYKNISKLYNLISEFLKI